MNEALQEWLNQIPDCSGLEPAENYSMFFKYRDALWKSYGPKFSFSEDWDSDTYFTALYALMDKFGLKH